MERLLIIRNRDKGTGRITEKLIPLPASLDRRIKELLQHPELLPPHVKLTPLLPNARILVLTKRKAERERLLALMPAAGALALLGAGALSLLGLRQQRLRQQEQRMQEQQTETQPPESNSMGIIKAFVANLSTNAALANHFANANK